MDRKDYRRADWLDCSERAMANITLSSGVELKEGKRKAFGRQIIRIFEGNDNLADETLNYSSFSELAVPNAPLGQCSRSRDVAEWCNPVQLRPLVRSARGHTSPLVCRRQIETTNETV